MALVTVIVAVAFVAILVSIMMAVSLVNFKMKAINERGKDSFYSAEQVLDEISVGLQEQAASALTLAYNDVMSNYSVYDDDAKKAAIETAFYTNMIKFFAHSTGDDPVKIGTGVDEYKGDYKVSDLEDMLMTTSKWRSASVTGTGQGYGAILTTKDKDGNEVSDSGIIYFNNGLVLKDLKVWYKDASGFVSCIRTDIKINCPTFDFAKDSSIADLANYSFIADGGAEFESMSSLLVDGNIYANNIKASDIANMHIGEEDGIPRTVISKYDLNFVNTNVDSIESTELWASNIIVNGSEADLDAIMSVRNDIDIRGNGSKVKLKGEYVGYGKDALDGTAMNSVDDGSGNPSTTTVKIYKSNESSAMLVNGTNSSIDLSGLDKFILAGHAYVGTSDRSTSSDALKEIMNNAYITDQEKNELTELQVKIDRNATHDVDALTGESITVKTNQLVYLIPPEAIGVDIETGRSLYNSNPLTQEQYEAIKDKNVYDEVSVTAEVSDLGSTLLDYIQTEKVTREYIDTTKGNQRVKEERVVGKPQRVFVASADGSGKRLVYYYMAFKDADAAAKYYAQNYANNKDSIDNYTKSYIKNLKLPSILQIDGGKVPKLKYMWAGNNIWKDAEKSTADKLEFTNATGNIIKDEEKDYVETTSEAMLAEFVDFCTNLKQERAGTKTPAFAYSYAEEEKILEAPIIGGTPIPGVTPEVNNVKTANQVVFENLISEKNVDRFLINVKAAMEKNPITGAEGEVTFQPATETVELTGTISNQYLVGSDMVPDYATSVVAPGSKAEIKITIDEDADEDADVPSSIRAVVVKGDYTVTDASTRVVIATGDVTINVTGNEYKGLIICDGKVKSTNGELTLTADPDYVVSALNGFVVRDVYADGSGEGPKVLSVFYGYEDSTGTTNPTEKDDPETKKYKAMSKLVTYENWKRE